MKNKPLASDVDLDFLAKSTLGFAGADLAYEDPHLMTQPQLECRLRVLGLVNGRFSRDFKMSGFGREFGVAGMQAFTEPRAVFG